MRWDLTPVSHCQPDCRSRLNAENPGPTSRIPSVALTTICMPTEHFGIMTSTDEPSTIKYTSTLTVCNVPLTGSQSINDKSTRPLITATASHAPVPRRIDCIYAFSSVSVNSPPGFDSASEKWSPYSRSICSRVLSLVSGKKTT